MEQILQQNPKTYPGGEGPPFPVADMPESPWKDLWARR
jgi:hypothetical protein